MEERVTLDLSLEQVDFLVMVLEERVEDNKIFSDQGGHPQEVVDSVIEDDNMVNGILSIIGITE